MISQHPLQHFRAFGLSFASAFPLPELAAIPRQQPDQADPTPDIVIELGPVFSLKSLQEATAEDAPPESILSFSPQRSHILFSEVGRFTISNGNHIFLEPLEGRSASSWRLSLLGSVMAMLLEQRGLFVLHAGALDFGNCAAAFLGEKGQGKSTLNAALSQAGHPLLSDDVVALRWPDDAPSSGPGFPSVLPGFGQIKLVPDAVRAVLGDPDKYPVVAPELSDGFDKRSFMAPLASRAMPLRHLFVLSSLDEEADESHDEAIQLRALAPQEALIRLIPHTFGARFGELYLQGERRTSHFRSCARLVRECQVWELARRRDLTLLPATIAAIQAVIEEPREL